jgi:hypothetical protein
MLALGDLPRLDGVPRVGVEEELCMNFSDSRDWRLVWTVKDNRNVRLALCSCGVQFHFLGASFSHLVPLSFNS